MVATLEAELPRQLPAAIVNSIRSSLDILASVLAKRNGKKPSSSTHFPIRSSASDLQDAINDIERKKWLSQAEIAEIKALKPYKGGDDSIWPMHQLDIIRKHERLATVSIDFRGFLITDRGIKSMSIKGGKVIMKRLDNKTVLAKASPGDAERLADGDAQAFLDVQLNESAIGLTDESVIPALRRFANKASCIISRFD